MFWPIRQVTGETRGPAPRRQFSITLFGDVHSYHYNHIACSFNSRNLYLSNVGNSLTDNSSTVVRDLSNTGVEIGKSWPRLVVDLLSDPG